MNSAAMLTMELMDALQVVQDNVIRGVRMGTGLTDGELLAVMLAVSTNPVLLQVMQ